MGEFKGRIAKCIEKQKIRKLMEVKIEHPRLGGRMSNRIQRGTLKLLIQKTTLNKDDLPSQQLSQCE